MYIIIFPFTEIAPNPGRYFDGFWSESDKISIYSNFCCFKYFLIISRLEDRHNFSLSKRLTLYMDLSISILDVSVTKTRLGVLVWNKSSGSLGSSWTRFLPFFRRGSSPNKTILQSGIWQKSDI